MDRKARRQTAPRSLHRRWRVQLPLYKPLNIRIAIRFIIYRMIRTRYLNRLVWKLHLGRVMIVRRLSLMSRVKKLVGGTRMRIRFLCLRFGLIRSLRRQLRAEGIFFFFKNNCIIILIDTLSRSILCLITGRPVLNRKRGDNRIYMCFHIIYQLGSLRSSSRLDLYTASIFSCSCPQESKLSSMNERFATSRYPRSKCLIINRRQTSLSQSVLNIHHLIPGTKYCIYGGNHRTTIV
jgi:hypothetical protein